jgi:hypothetical protein
VAGADFLAAFDASYFLGALAPVDFLAVYLVLAILYKLYCITDLNICLNISEIPLVQI